MEKPKVRSKATLALLASLSILEVSFFLFISKIDGIVSGDLYNYGLQYSYEWAGQYWNAVSSFQFATLVSTILIIIALSSFLAYRNKRSSVLKKVCYLTIAFVIILNIFNIYFLENIDYIINHDLYLFQLTFSYNWANPYWSLRRHHRSPRRCSRDHHRRWCRPA